LWSGSGGSVVVRFAVHLWSGWSRVRFICGWGAESGLFIVRVNFGELWSGWWVVGELDSTIRLSELGSIRIEEK